MLDYIIAVVTKTPFDDRSNVLNFISQYKTFILLECSIFDDDLTSFKNENNTKEH